MKNETIELLYNRKSVRAYEKREIPEEDVQKILRAAIEAPTAGNMTLWSAIRVKRRKSACLKPVTISRLSRPLRWYWCSARITSVGTICLRRWIWAKSCASRAKVI